MDQQEIRNLVERYRMYHDQGAFRQLFALYSERVWLFILSKNIRRDEAEALFQEVGLSLAKFLKKETPDHFMGLVFKITKDHIAAHFRKHLQRPTPTLVPLEEVEQNPGDQQHPTQQWEDMEQCRQVLVECGMTEEQREAFVLHHAWELRVREIARLQDVPPDTVKSRIYLGKRKIKTYLDRKQRIMP